MKQNNRYLISTDGGGTKTGICVCDLENNLIRSCVCGGGNYKVHGIKTVQKNILDGLRQLLPDCENIPCDAAFIVMGFSGCDSLQDKEIYAKMMEDAGFPGEKFYICNDSEMAFRSVSDAPGICTIAGTGTIALSFEKNGSVQRAGGWGAPISDRGSGYWIGAEMISGLLSWIDGLGQFNEFYNKILEAYPQNSPDEIAANLCAQQPDQIAEWAKPVIEAASQNQFCRDIVSGAAGKIAELVFSVYNKSGFSRENHVDIVESGSLFSSTLYETEFRNALRQMLPAVNYGFIRSDKTPAEDGISLARKMYMNLRKTQSDEPTDD